MKIQTLKIQIAKIRNQFQCHEEKDPNKIDFIYELKVFLHACRCCMQANIIHIYILTS